MILKVKELHTEASIDFIFLSGSAIKGNFSTYSDLDYTACISEKITHPRFYFTVVTHEGVKRVVSIYFYESVELIRKPEEIDDDYYLWEKDMMPNSQLVYGDKKLYENLVKMCVELDYSRKPKQKTIHKSFGKLIELLVKMKKYYDRCDDMLVKYYGIKLAEHVRRLVLEFNGPIHLKGESEFTAAHFAMRAPKCFSRGYSTLTGLSFEYTSPKKYYATAMRLVHATIAFMQSQDTKDMDNFTLELLRNRDLHELLKSLT